GTRILTAAHVIGDATDITVRTGDGRIRKARLRASDRASDLALLYVDDRLPPLEFAGDATAGAPVCAVGNAFGLGLSMSCGVVSAVRRSGVGFNAIEDFVQTDAAANPGMSGGALVDEEGRLAGVVTAIFTKNSDANIGVNFAVAAPLAKTVLEALDRTGGFRPLQSGMQLAALPVDNDGELALLVRRVAAGSPAEKAGIVAGDRILTVGGRRVTKPGEAAAAFARLVAPASVELGIVREGAALSVAVEFPAAP
ncbi:MAG: S1C family serine protease, partial [Flavobacteriaceae bacterium]